MNPKFWLSVAFLMSRIGIFEAAGQCNQVEYSIGQMYLRGHTFKTYKVGWPHDCFFKCDEEVTCQSYNFHIGQKVCELNNRTKEARPEDFMPDQTRFYMKRAQNRGTHFSPRLLSLSNTTTQQFWRLQPGFQFMCFMVFYPIVLWDYATNFADTNIITKSPPPPPPAKK